MNNCLGQSMFLCSFAANGWMVLLAHSDVFMAGPDAQIFSDGMLVIGWRNTLKK